MVIETTIDGVNIMVISYVKSQMGLNPIVSSTRNTELHGEMNLSHYGDDFGSHKRNKQTK